MSEQKTIVLGVTGSIAAYKAADIIRILRKKGFIVSVVMTEKSEKFITPLTLSSLSGRKVFCGCFNDDTDASIAHIDLAQDAAAVLIAPATANVIGKIAHGLADDLLSCICLATRAPIVFAPAMNTQMMTNQIVVENIDICKKRGMHVVDAIEGDLACGDRGAGHLAKVEDIVAKVEEVI